MAQVGFNGVSEWYPNQTIIVALLNAFGRSAYYDNDEESTLSSSAISF